MDDLVAEIPSLVQFPRQPHPIDGGEDVEIRTRNATLCQIAILIETLHEFVSRFQEPPLDIFGRCFPGPQDFPETSFQQHLDRGHEGPNRVRVTPPIVETPPVQEFHFTGRRINAGNPFNVFERRGDIRVDLRRIRRFSDGGAGLEREVRKEDDIELDPFRREEPDRHTPGANLGGERIGREPPVGIQEEIEKIEVRDDQGLEIFASC